MKRSETMTTTTMILPMILSLTHPKEGSAGRVLNSERIVWQALVKKGRWWSPVVFAQTQPEAEHRTGSETGAAGWRRRSGHSRMRIVREEEKSLAAGEVISERETPHADCERPAKIGSERNP